MKTLFALISLVLIGASALTFYSFSERQKERPVLRWMAAVNPAREKQAELFEKWMVDNGYPAVELKIEGPKRASKNIVQGVAGVAGDIFDCYAGEMILFQAVGLLEDVTEIAPEMGFGLSGTYSRARAELLVDGRQYAFPRSVQPSVLWVNVDAFEEKGLPLPPKTWSFEEFEELGKRYVEFSNKPGEYQTVYFTKYWGLWDITILLRSMGVDMFNETLTGSNWDSPESKEIYTMLYRWMNELNLLPTGAEAKALTAGSSSTSRWDINLFAQGNFALTMGGQFSLMYYREVGPTNLSIIEFPHKTYRNTMLYACSSAVYKGSKQKDLAVYFLKFMASDTFNRGIIEDPDGLPPVPKYAFEETYSHPVDYPNEWGLHDELRDALMDLGIPFSYSPFIQASTVTRRHSIAFSNLLADRLSIEDALNELAVSIEQEMVRYMTESKGLKEKYEKQLQNQAEIERLRLEGELVPLKLISNPFYRQYYLDMGWSLPEGAI